MEKVVKHFLFWQKYAETVCFGTFCIILKSKWLNLPKTLVSVKLVYFYAKIICFSTFCIIPVQMVKSAEIICFGTFCYSNYMVWHF